MNFELSDEQAMLRDATRELLRDRSPIEVIRAHLDGVDDAGPDVDPVLWRLGAEIGWTGLALPEQVGGFDQGMVELAIVAHELGRSLARGPFIPTMLVGSALVAGGSAELRAEALPALADGSAAASWAFAEPHGPWAIAAVAATATVDGNDAVLNGVKTAVQDARDVRWLLVTARLRGELVSFLVDSDTPGVAVRRQHVLDLTRHFHEVRFEDVRVPLGRQVNCGPARTQSLLDKAAVLLCAGSLGVGERLLELTVDYVKVREQFGRPVGSFQAVKQKAATMAMQIQGCYAATYLAAMTIDAAGTDAGLRVGAAKAFVSDAVSRVAGDALQLHGGIGFTWEHPLHLYLRRAKVDEVLYGDVRTHRDRLTGLLRRTQPAVVDGFSN